MTAIAGIADSSAKDSVNEMLDRMAHRGPVGRLVISTSTVTMGVDWPEGQPDAHQNLIDNHIAADHVSDSHYAQAQVVDGTFTLKRDPIGVSPMYYGNTASGKLAFASEAKALFNLVDEVLELQPGCTYRQDEITSHFQLDSLPTLTDPPEEIAQELRRRLENSISERAQRGVPFGSWLSGGIDSSIQAALARPYTDRLHTFAAGFEGAPDLAFARLVADHIQADHHEMIATLDDLIAVLPEVIFHLESFDALLVRSSMMNFLVAKLASDYVPAVFSGEGGDELFGGYTYLKDLPLGVLPEELIDIIGRLHNTALQRVDRSSAAHGTIAYVGFLAPEVVEYALRIPAEYKIRGGVEKWILRQAVTDLLPESVVNRTKAKFWEGAGVEELLARYADEQISDEEFQQERTLLPGEWELNSKEELLYYRIFREHFGDIDNLIWMGRTKVTSGKNGASVIVD
jgi:asparagine synthase (glutamine-hydrolysing)